MHATFSVVVKIYEIIRILFIFLKESRLEILSRRFSACQTRKKAALLNAKNGAKKFYSVQNFFSHQARTEQKHFHKKISLRSFVTRDCHQKSYSVGCAPSRTITMLIRTAHLLMARFQAIHAMVFYDVSVLRAHEAADCMQSAFAAINAPPHR